MNTICLKPFHAFKVEDAYFMFIIDNMDFFEIEQDLFLKLQHCEQNTNYQFSYDEADTDMIEDFKECGIVCTDDSEKCSTCVSQEERKGLSGIVLQVSNDCNLNCLYCYGSGGCYSRQRELMDMETAKEAIDFLLRHREENKKLLVTFFGGEPLMNVPVIKGTIRYCREIEEETDVKFSYSMTTNGTIQNDEIMDIIKENRIHVMISMDGDKTLQDMYRPYVGGQGSYDRIVKNIEKFKEANGGKITARATLCKDEPRITKIKADLEQIGFDNAHVSVVDVPKDSALYVGEEEKKVIAEEYLKIAKQYIENVKNKIQNQIPEFDGILHMLYHKYHMERSCGAQVHNCAIGTNGLVYPCQRFMGMDDYVTGSVHKMELKDFYIPKVDEKDECKSCWAKYLCGGGCLYTCVSNQSDIYKAPIETCEISKWKYELIIYIYHQLKQLDSDIFKKLFEKKKNDISDCV